MTTQFHIQIQAQQYLHSFQLNYQHNKNLLKSLEEKLNHAAKIIQRSWRFFIKNKKNKMARKIQSVWKKYRVQLSQRMKKIQKFKQTYKKTIIYLFLKSKLNKNNQSKLNKNNRSGLNKTYRCKQQNKFNQTPINAFYRGQNQLQRQKCITHKIQKNFTKHLTQSQAYKAEKTYIQKLRIYEKSRFSQMWQKYEQKLRAELKKLMSKRWIKKNKQIYISNQNKEVNVQKYIEFHVDKIFKREYQHFKNNDNQLQKSSNILSQNQKKIKTLYFIGLLNAN